jgi:UDP-N-acetylglucosamine 2-epimerase
MKIISIIGARPQFIKAAVVSQKLIENGIDEKIVHTGQHYDFNMSDIFFKELNIAEPAYYLNIGSASHGEQTGRMLTEIEKVLLEEKPGMVLVYGDTNTTLAGSLAAVKLHIPVAHVEAGLRSFNKRMPEEINRILTDRVSDFLFSPTETGLENLKKEGFSNIVHAGESVPPGSFTLPLAVNVGDVMFDIALALKKKSNEHEVLTRHGLTPKEFLLATVHRAENTDDSTNLCNIWTAFKEMARQGKTVFFPLHPRTRNALKTNGLLNEIIPGKLVLADPVSYTDMIVLESTARAIVTDSGGVQKEGYFFKTPCVIAREQTEWVELVDSGWNVLTGADSEKIVSAVLRFWENGVTAKESGAIFGNGDASDKIAMILKAFLKREL